MKKLLTTINLVLISSQAFSFGFNDQAYGSKFEGMNARNLSLGKTSITSDYTPSSLMKNPALLGKGSNFKFSIGSYFTGINERRAMPIYDSFDSRTIETTVAKNDDIYYNPYFAMSYGFYLDAIDSKIGLAVGYFPAFSFDYNYTEDIRNNDPFSLSTRDVIIARATRKMEGSIDALSFGFSETFSNISIGASLALYKIGGKTKYLERLLDTTDGKNISNDQIIAVQDYEITVTDELSNTPFGLNFGANYDLNERFSFGAFVQTPVEFKFENKKVGFKNTPSDLDTVITLSELTEITSLQNISIGSEYSYKTPLSMGIGTTFKPRNEFNAKVYFDVEMTKWSSINTDTTFTGESERNIYRSTNLYRTVGEDTLLSPVNEFEDTWEFKLGVEYIFENGVPIRIGFDYSPTYYFEDVIYTNVTLGTGWNFGNLTVDVGMSLGQIEYTQAHLFTPTLYYQNPIQQQETVKVKESLLKTMISATYEF